MRRTIPVVVFCLSLLSFGLVILNGAPAKADDVSDFYRGKTLRLLVGYGAGAGYDVYIRLLGRHIAKHIPGQPGIIVQNMPGAASLTMANNLYNIAPRDGTAIGMPARWIFTDPLFGNANARFDAQKFIGIGSMNREVATCLSWHSSGFKTIEDTMQRELLAGSSGVGGTSWQFPQLLNALIGTKFKVISGYPDSAAVGIAMERGEVAAYCSFTWGSIKSARPQWLEKKQINVMLQLTLKKHPELPNVPIVMDYARDDAARQAFALSFADQDISRPMLAPPGVPAERVAALRQAFDATMKDKDFLADAARSSIDIDPVGGEEMERVIARIYQTPKAVVDRVKAIYANGGQTK